MYVALVHCHVKPDKVEAFLEASRANHEGSIREPGCLRFDVIRSTEDPYRFVLYEWYVDEAAAAFHKTQAHYHAWRETAEGLLVEPRYSVRYQGIYPSSAAGA